MFGSLQFDGEEQIIGLHPDADAHEVGPKQICNGDLVYCF